MHHADALGLKQMLAVAKDTEARDGRGFEVAPLLAELVSSQRNFSTLNGA